MAVQLRQLFVLRQGDPAVRVQNRLLQRNAVCLLGSGWCTNVYSDVRPLSPQVPSWPNWGVGQRQHLLHTMPQWLRILQHSNHLRCLRARLQPAGHRLPRANTRTAPWRKPHRQPVALPHSKRGPGRTCWQPRGQASS